MSTSIISLQGISKSHHDRPLFENITLGIDQGEKIGIIGANGAGKSTLLRIIAGQEESDSGKINLRKSVRIGFLEQIPTLDEKKTAREVIEEGLLDLRSAIAAYEKAAENEGEDTTELLLHIEQLGGWDYEHRIKYAALQLGINFLDQKIGLLSGGERKRVALARLILEEPDLILLDEPTNHLDAETVDWLEGWFKASKSSIILVTHDRYFLDRVVNRLIEVRDGGLHSYPGNYTDFLEARAIEEAHRERTHHRQLKVLMTELEWARRSPMARTTKSQSRLDRIGEVQANVERLTGKEFKANFQFGETPRLGGIILEFENVKMSYDDGPVLIKDLTLNMKKGERIGILGSNGAGKSTLLKLITGDLTPVDGKVKIGHNTKFAYFDQHRSEIDPEASVRKIVSPEGNDTVFPYGGAGIHIASWLDQFGFDHSQHSRPVHSLSGGERNRLAIARFLLQDANLLILDEPTNDLDIPTLNMLEEAIANFAGCVLLVSHDRYLLDKIATGIIGFEAEYEGPGTVTFVQGNYTNYNDLRLKKLKKAKEAREKEELSAQRANKEKATKKKGNKKALTWAEDKEFKKLEPLLEKLDERVSELEEELADPAIWANGTEKGREIQTLLDAAKAESEKTWARWQELSEKAEG